MKHYNVLIATPGNSLSNMYVKSLTETLSECDNKNISYKWLNSYSSLVHHARELTVTGGNSLELDPDHKGPLGDTVTYDKIFLIDSDISWKVEDFFKLYNSDLEVISGAYLLFNGLVSTIHTENFPGGIPKNKIVEIKDIQEANSIGLGFVAVKSGVFESIERPWFAHLPQAIQTSSGKIIYDSVGEDISWCMRVKNSGKKIYFDPTVLVNHIKTVSLGWDL